MPTTRRGQHKLTEEPDGDGGASAGEPASVEPATIPRTGGDAALITLAKMFESFMAVQKERDDRQEREATKQEQNYRVRAIKSPN